MRTYVKLLLMRVCLADKANGRMKRGCYWARGRWYYYKRVCLRRRRLFGCKERGWIRVYYYYYYYVCRY